MSVAWVAQGIGSLTDLSQVETAHRASLRRWGHRARKTLESHGMVARPHFLLSY